MRITQPEQECSLLGKYGRMRKQYLKEHRPILFSNLLLSEKLYPHLAEINQSCVERMEPLIRQMADREGVTESLKAIVSTSVARMAWKTQ